MSYQNEPNIEEGQTICDRLPRLATRYLDKLYTGSSVPNQEKIHGEMAKLFRDKLSLLLHE